MNSHPHFNYVFANIKPEIINETRKLLEKFDIFTVARIFGFKTEHYDYLQIAGRLLMLNNFLKCSPTIADYIEDMKDRFQPKYYNFIKANINVIDSALDRNIKNNYKCDFSSASKLIDDYLAKLPYDDEPAETPQYLWLRVAVQLHFEAGIEKVLKHYNEFSEGLGIVASPMLFNSCFKKNTLSSCFIRSVDDSLDDILEAIKDFGHISKGTGALGCDLSKLRCSTINGTGKASGIVKLCKLFSEEASYIDQAGKRNGSIALSLRDWHYDLRSFIELTDKNGPRDKTALNVNTSLFLSNLFFERVENGGKWTLFCPAKVPWLNDLYGPEFSKKYIETEKLAIERENTYIALEKTYTEKYTNSNYTELKELKKQLLECKKKRIMFKTEDARSLYESMIKSQMKTGYPFLANADSINMKHNQMNIGTVGAFNLCQEITLATTGKNFPSCNLGSISFPEFFKEKYNSDKPISNCINFKKLGDFTMSQIENIDSAITHNHYILSEYDSDGNVLKIGPIQKTNIENRPIGLGVQGFAENIYMLDLRPEEDSVVVSELNKLLFACIYFNALCKSVDLAISAGPYKNFKGSPFSRGELQFDLWQKELEVIGSNSVRKSEPKILDPSEWNQSSYELSNGDIILPTWDSLKRCIMKYGTRNSNLTTVMPTATCSIPLRNTESVEFPQSMLYAKKLLNGSYPILVRFMVFDLENINTWNKYTCEYLKNNDGDLLGFDNFVMSNKNLYPTFKESDLKRLQFCIQKYKPVWRISQKYLLQLNSDRSRYIDMSHSQNIYMKESTISKLQASHLYASKLGLKCLCYYLRQGSPQDNMTFTIDPVVKEAMNKCNIENIYDDKNVKSNVQKSSESTNEGFDEFEVCDPNNPDCLACQ